MHIYKITVSGPDFLKPKLPREMAGGRGERAALQNQWQALETNLVLWCSSRTQCMYITRASIKVCSTYVFGESSSYSYLKSVMGGVTA